MTERDVLAALSAYADEHDGWLACDFELAEDGEQLARGFFKDEELARSFEVFGHDGMLGLYARWRSDEEPVVYLAADWEETGVLCDTLEEFAALLTLGRDRVGMLSDWDADQEACEGIDEFRAWAERELGVERPAAEDARAMVERARAEHPDLKAWIDDRRP